MGDPGSIEAMGEQAEEEDDDEEEEVVVVVVEVEDAEDRFRGLRRVTASASGEQPPSPPRDGEASDAFGSTRWRLRTAVPDFPAA